MTDDLNTEAPKAHQPPLSAREEWTDFMKTAVIAVILAMVIRTFLYEPFNIPSGSMKPTLEIGDYLFVSKPSYGFSHFSFPFGISPLPDTGRVMAKLPSRGDIVVFKLPTNTSIDFIKRIIGLPGDTIQVIEGRLYINHHMVKRQTIGLRRVDENGESTTVTEYLETLPNGLVHHIYEMSDNGQLDNTKEFKVPEGHYFMMGDNRDNSQDSRVMDHVGYVPYENLVGRASFIFFSTNGYANMAEVWKWPKSIRYNRLFKIIEPNRPEPENADTPDAKTDAR
ncbi:MAG: lepB [Micavibrio sp.]|nr:lepB [Micavibrio sp.]